MRYLILTLPLLSLACEEPKTCTLVDCISGLTLNITDSFGEPATNAHGTVIIDGEELNFDCRIGSETDNVICDYGQVLFEIVGAETLSYSIMNGDIEVANQENIALSYEESMPNGEDCLPVCSNASVDVEMGRPSGPPPE